MLARAFARTMTFPGSTMQLSRELSNDYLRRLSIFLENVTASTSDFCSTLTVILSGRIKKFDKKFIMTKYTELQPIISTLSNYLKWIKSSVQYYTSISASSTSSSSSLSNTNSCKNWVFFCYPETPSLKQPEIELIQKFITFFEKYMVCYDDFHPLVISFCNKLNYASNNANLSIDTILDRDEKESLMYATSQFLKISEELKNITGQLKPVKTSNESELGGLNGGSASQNDNMLMSGIKMIRQLNTGPTGLSLLSMPIMRAQLYDYYNAEEIKLNGADGQFIDAIFIPSSVS